MHIQHKKKTAVPLFCFLLCSILLSLACDNDTPIYGRADLVNRDDLGSILQISITATTDSTAGKVVNTVASPFVLLGTFKNLESRILLRFDPLPDSGTVIAAKLKLPAEEATGQVGSFTATVHQVTTPWKESEVTWGENDFPVQFNPAMDTQPIVPAVTDTTDTIAFKLDPQVVATWMSSKGADKDTNGVLLQAQNATFIKAFPSRVNLSRLPFLELTSRRRVGSRDTTITTRRTATASVFVFKRLAPLPANRLYVGNGERWQSVFSFRLNTSRLDSIPQDATINRALATFQIDADKSVFVDNDDLLIYSLYYTQKKYGVDTLTAPADSLVFIQQTSASVTTTSVEFNLTSLVQAWVLRPPKNYGDLFLLPDFPASSLRRMALYARKTEDAPTLRIDYTTPPKAR